MTPGDPGQATGQVLPEFDRDYQNRTLFLLAAAVAAMLYVEGMLTPSLLPIAKEFGVTPSQVSLVLALYAASGVALNPVIGKLGDIYGKKKVLTYVLAAYAAAVSVTGFSPTFDFMLGARAVQGVGLTISPLAISLVREEFPVERVPRAQGILASMFAVGFAVSLPLGSFISNDLGWRWTYHTAIPLVLLLLALVAWKVRESPYRRPGVKVDFGGASLLGLSLVLLVLAIAEGPSWGWSSVGTVSVATAGFLVLLPLFFYERGHLRRGGEPVLDMKLFHMRNATVPYFGYFVSGLGMFLAFQAFVYKFELPPPIGYGLTYSRRASPWFHSPLAS